MLKQPVIFLLLLTTLFSFQCRKPKSELEKLPAEIQTDAGCVGKEQGARLFTPQLVIINQKPPFMPTACSFIKLSEHSPPL